MPFITNQSKVICISTNDVTGGAPRACYRLFQGLKLTHNNCKLLVQYKNSNDEEVIIAPSLKLYPKDWFDRDIESLIFTRYIESNRSNLTNTYFSLSFPGNNIADLDLIKDAEIINLHWVENFLSPLSIAQLGKFNKPIVWTLHDQRPFTGGCHYTAGCERFIEGLCMNCPQIDNDKYNLPHAVLLDKLHLFEKLNLTIVTPSRWLAGEAKKSILFKNRPIEVIPYSIDTKLYKPQNKITAKRSLDIDPAVTTILFGAVNSKEERKGFRYLLNAIEIAIMNPSIENMVYAKKINIICMGDPDTSISKFHIPIINTNYLESDEQIINVYNASDIFILPSTEDNLPLGIMEAMACGVPVIGFATGGIRELIQQDTGILVENKNSLQLAEAIVKLVTDDEMRTGFGRNSRKLIEDKYKLTLQAEAYSNLFTKLKNENTEAKYSDRNNNALADVKKSFYKMNLTKLIWKLLLYSIIQKNQDKSIPKFQLYGGRLIMMIAPLFLSVIPAMTKKSVYIYLTTWLKRK